MKILLAIAPWDMWEAEETTRYPNGLGYLAAILEKNKHEVDILDLTYSKWENVKDNVEEKVRKFNPDILGVSILSNSRISALKLMNFVKEIKKEIIIIAGGVHTTCLPEQVLKNYPVNYAVLGEGEITLIELINAIKYKKNKEFFKKIKGISLIDDGEVIKTLPRERIKDLDSLPFPKHELFINVIKKYNYAQIMSSRGCPFSCAFCPSSVHWGRCMIQRSAKNIFEEMKYILKKFPNVQKIFFNDDEFICNNKKIIELCQIIIKNNLKIEWSCLGRVSSINEELIKIMKEAGCTQIIFGIESGSQRILDRIGKKVKIEDIINSINLCKKYNIEINYLTIVGLPGENAKSVKESIKLAKRLRMVSEPAILIIYPGTEVYRLAKEKGQITDDYWLSEGLCPLYTSEHPKWRLWWWSFKTGFITHIYAEDGDLKEFLDRKIFIKLKPHNFFRIFKRYVTEKT